MRHSVSRNQHYRPRTRSRSLSRSRSRSRSRSSSQSSESDKERSRRIKRQEPVDYDRPRGYYKKSREESCYEYDSKRRRSRSRSPYDKKQHKDGSTHRNSRNPMKSSTRESYRKEISLQRRTALPAQDLSYQSSRHPSAVRSKGGLEPKPELEKQKPNFAPTGLLAAASNSVVKADGSTIALKYHEPLEARKPPAKDVWKLFVFKGPDILETVELSRRSYWLIGRDSTVADILAEHPSVSNQHAVIQFRYVEKKNEYGDRHGKVRPYLIDLDSVNGTSLNKVDITGSRYLELRDKDMIKFGHSSREYVLMLEPKK